MKSILWNARRVCLPCAPQAAAQAWAAGPSASCGTGQMAAREAIQRNPGPGFFAENRSGAGDLIGTEIGLGQTYAPIDSAMISTTVLY